MPRRSIHVEGPSAPLQKNAGQEGEEGVMDGDYIAGWKSVQRCCAGA